MNLKSLKSERLLHIEGKLKPVGSDRAQPASFANIGITTYRRPGGKTISLVDTQASMANRLEALCWDQNASFDGKEKAGHLCEPLRGLPYIRVTDKKGELKLTSLHGYHRIATDYILEAKSGGKTIAHLLLEKAKIKPPNGEARRYLQPGDMARVYEAVFELDPLSLVHGFWIAQSEHVAGLIRVPRALCSEITAVIVQEVPVPGTKFDTFNPEGKESKEAAEQAEPGEDKKRKGKGTVPHEHTEIVPEETTATFILDLEQIRNYGFADERADLLFLLSVWKIRRFLDSHLRLRSNCIFEADGEPCTLRPKTGFSLPNGEDLDKAVKDAITKSSFPKKAVTVAINDEL